MKRHFRHLLSPLLVASSLFAAQAPSVRPTTLRCEYRNNPLGIDIVKPRLSWVLNPLDPKARGLSQSAYRVIAVQHGRATTRGQG